MGSSNHPDEEPEMTQTGQATPARMLLRGAAKRCASCGGRRLFTGWFRMAPTCPTCGYRFEREEGFFLGAYVMNLVFAQGLVILLAVLPTIVMLNANPDASIIPVIVGGAVATVLGPLVFYPFSKTLWVAVELIFRPREVVEPGDARRDALARSGR
jgi:uncharacterized protein (DUF983 family)